MTYRIEDLKIEELWQLFLQLNPPPVDMPTEVVLTYRSVFMNGAAVAVKIAQRLWKVDATKERAESVLAGLEKQLVDDVESRSLTKARPT